MLDSNLSAPPASQDVTATLEQMEGFYATGKLLQAYRLGERWGAPDAWPGTRAAILAGRILNNLGAPRNGRRLHLKAFRKDPTDPQAVYYCVYCVLERRGPLAAIEYGTAAAQDLA